MTTTKRARSAVTGRFVRLAYALRHPHRTVIETIKRKIRS